MLCLCTFRLNPFWNRIDGNGVHMDDLKNSTGELSELNRSGLEPELGGWLRHEPELTGLEPELGGVLRQKGVYVDEITCIGCKHCAHVARNTFYIEPDYGRSRVVSQDSDSEEMIQEAIDTCPVDCIHWLDYTELKQHEEDRKYQVVPVAGFQIDHGAVRRQAKAKKKKTLE